MQSKTDLPFVHTKRFLSPEYTLLDWFKFLAGNLKSGVLWEEMLTIDFFSSITSLSIPVYFCSGRYDYQTPYALVQEYCDVIEAPIKDDLVPKFSTFS